MRYRIRKQKPAIRISHPRRRHRESPAIAPRRHNRDRLPLHPDHTLREVEQDKDEKQRWTFANKIENVHAFRLREKSFLARAATPAAPAASNFHNHLNAPVFTSAAVPPPTIKPVRP